MLLLSTGSLYTQPVARVFAWAREAGFEGIELLVDDRPESQDVAHVRRCVEETGLPVPVVHVPFHSRVIPEWGTDSVDRALLTAELARELGAGMVVLHLPLWREERFARWIVEERPQAEKKLGLALAVENLPAKRWLVPGPRIFRWPFLFHERRGDTYFGRLLHALSQPDFRFNTAEELCQFNHVVFDVTHWARRGDVFGFWETLKGRVVHIHVSNYSPQRGHAVPWEGEVNLVRFLEKVRADGYQGHFTAELCPQTLGDPKEDEVRARLRTVVQWFRQELVP